MHVLQCIILYPSKAICIYIVCYVSFQALEIIQKVVTEHMLPSLGINMNYTFGQIKVDQRWTIRLLTVD